MSECIPLFYPRDIHLYIANEKIEYIYIRERQFVGGVEMLPRILSSSPDVVYI